ncbi:extracellular solute-binding protein [Paenibacillus macerans]|uniref:Extracellular solute-binding protein n=1 Tax=Paenibacillus macerans TaxID=44252 RepID=A0A6N8EQN4_PAEMA|nr:extracellular solute-binding protein [Paenibacillus macerans]MUG22239.1 extracellular solute-binding protein [Paenibacillus macerans]
MRGLLLFFMALNLAIVSGCAGNTSSLKDKEVSFSLNIGYFSQKHFDDRYASLLALEYPNLRYTVVPTNDIVKGKATLQEWMKNNEVDLLYLSDDDFREAAESGLLLKLDDDVARDSFPLDTLIPGVVELTKHYGNGELYGLPPSFFSSAIVYNQQLFDQYGVEYPGNQMSWEDTIMLANRFPKGLTLPYPSAADWLIDIGRTESLQAYDEHTDRLTLDSPSWGKILKLVKEPLKRGNIAINDINQNAFITENYAMAVVNYEDFKVVEQQGSDIKWKLATMPVSPGSPEISHHISLGGLWAIPANSTQTEAAWELIRFFLSGKVAEWEYRSVYGFSSLADYISLGNADKNIEAFYMLQPSKEENAVSEQAYNLINAYVDRMLSSE